MMVERNVLYIKIKMTCVLYVHLLVGTRCSLKVKIYSKLRIRGKRKKTQWRSLYKLRYYYSTGFTTHIRADYLPISLPKKMFNHQLTMMSSLMRQLAAHINDVYRHENQAYLPLCCSLPRRQMPSKPPR